MKDYTKGAKGKS